MGQERNEIEAREEKEKKVRMKPSRKERDSRQVN
jgi:hypothetical protein